MNKFKTIRNIDVAGKAVLVRVDFNVPFNAQGEVSDATRVSAALPTIEYLLKQNAKVILVSHLGRPKGKRVAEYSLRPVADVLSKLIHRPVLFVDDCVGDKVEGVVKAMVPGSILLLENLRFYPGEEANDAAFAQQLAKPFDVYVNDAFGTAHRAHASTYGVAKLLPVRVAGFLMEKELTFLGEKTSRPERPFTVVLGGAKVSDKIKVIDALLEKADRMLIGGGMAYTFMLAQGYSVGKSLTELDCVEIAKAALEKAAKRNVEFLLPVDHLITDNLDFANGKVGTLRAVEGNIDAGWMGVDIGPKTLARYEDVIRHSKTILWNGPMGVFEIAECAKGTFALAKAVAESDALSIIGGGDSVKAIKKSGNADKVTFISTGGGASLEFLEGVELPGVQVLDALETCSISK